MEDSRGDDQRIGDLPFVAEHMGQGDGMIDIGGAFSALAPLVTVLTRSKLERFEDNSQIVCHNLS
jgi:hypothetical protein